MWWMPEVLWHDGEVERKACRGIMRQGTALSPILHRFSSKAVIEQNNNICMQKFAVR
jgi:hypothetical protein